MLTSEQKSILAALLAQAVEEIKQAHEGAKQVASGRTRDSIAYEVTDQGGKITGRSPFATLETGRKAGNTPKGFVDIIRQWAKDKKIDIKPYEYKTDRPHKYTAEEAGLNRFAGAVAQKIKKSGTLLYRSGGRKDIYTPALDRLTEAIREQILANLAENALRDLKRL